MPAISDWSQHHVIFSKSATAEQAKLVERDPRYQQQLRRQLPARLPAVELGGMAPEVQSRIEAVRNRKNRDLGGLWLEDLGTGASVGAVNYPGKVSFSSKIVSCATDFVVYGTGLPGSAGQADIAAYGNLYSGCGGTVPSAYWGYNTNGGTVTTSPAFSGDATQVAFTQTDVSGHGNLVLLKWAASDGSVGAPHTLARTRGSAYFTCAAPCMTYFVLRDGVGVLHADSNSSIFYDYSDDIAYVGDDGGWLHKFILVFKGTPAEVRTGGWPVHVNAGSLTPALASPVFDGASGNVFVADVGGFLYRVSPGGFVTASDQLDFSAAEGGVGIVQGPIVDSTAGLVYVFASSDGSGTCALGADCAAVYELRVGFVGGTSGSKVTVGASTVSGNPPNPLYLGTFDSTYQNSVTGNLYVCGNTGGQPALYQVPITAGVLGTALAGPVLANTTTPCSPVTDILNPNASGGATERVFASVETNGVSSSACQAAGCIYNFNDTPWLPTTAYTVGQEVLDSNLHIEVVSVAGTSGGAAPHWSTSAGGPTTDGTVRWLNQASTPVSAFPLSGWQAGHTYAKNTEILDSNNNVELVTTGGKSGSGSAPTWNTTAGGTTTDNTVTWTNVGALGTASMAVSGGTSGIIIDNVVSSGTEAGASQVYFSTLSDQTCATSGGTGGCAVQASQSALH